MTDSRARILTSYYRPKPGGLCTRLFRCINGLLQQGHEVHYLSVVEFPIEHEHCHWHRFPWPASQADGFLFWLVFHMLAPWLLLWIGIRHRITHAFSFATNYALFLQPLRLLLRIPLTLFLRADAIENHRIKCRPRWLILLELLLEGPAIQGTRLYGVSRVLGESVAARHGLWHPRIVGVMRNDIPASTMAPTHQADGPLRLACVGVLEPRKNQSMVLDCMQALTPEDCHLYIYGDGPDYQRLSDMIESLGISQMASLMGWREPSDIWGSVDLLLLPSLHEGASNAALEAMQHGITVLASNIPEHREILPSSALLPLETPASWCQAIARICHAPRGSLAGLASEQQDHADLLRFDWEKDISDLITAP